MTSAIWVPFSPLDWNPGKLILKPHRNTAAFKRITFFFEFSVVWPSVPASYPAIHWLDKILIAAGTLANDSRPLTSERLAHRVDEASLLSLTAVHYLHVMNSLLPCHTPASVCAPEPAKFPLFHSANDNREEVPRGDYMPVSPVPAADSLLPVIPDSRGALNFSCLTRPDSHSITVIHALSRSLSVQTPIQVWMLLHEEVSGYAGWLQFFSPSRKHC